MPKDSERGAASGRPPDSEVSQRQRRAAHLADIARRRTTALAAAGLLAALALAGIFALVVSGGDDDDQQPTQSGASAAERLTRRNAVRLQGAGIALVKPRGWRSTARQRAVRLRSPRGSTLITVLAPPDTRSPKAVLGQATEVIRSGLKDVRFLPSPSGQRVAGLPARFARFEAKTPQGTKVEGLLASAKGKSQVYLVQVVSQIGDRDRVAAQGVLNTLRLTK